MEKLQSYDPKEAKKRALARLKVVEKDVETLSKTINTLKLIRGIRPDMPFDKLIGDPFSLMSALEIKKHGLDTIIAKVDGLPEPELPMYFKQPSKVSFKDTHEEKTQLTPRKLSLSMKQEEEELRSPIMTIIYGTPHQAQYLTPISPGVENEYRDSLSQENGLKRCYAKVMYDFEGAQNTQEMSVACGDVIEVIETSDDG